MLCNVGSFRNKLQKVCLFSRFTDCSYFQLYIYTILVCFWERASQSLDPDLEAVALPQSNKSTICITPKKGLSMINFCYIIDTKENNEY